MKLNRHRRGKDQDRIAWPARFCGSCRSGCWSSVLVKLKLWSLPAVVVSRTVVGKRGYHHHSSSHHVKITRVGHNQTWLPPPGVTTFSCHRSGRRRHPA
ncbi:unnamed protein product [Nesidiocoris tenuis]|uniref:Uncharacterized protein n=1 Tax=Nesidiocoris tenuis TaxID=355587 RepID=A0A6H5HD87_9HEMI|nr:unnamed protein product [Nesidiocoris tenuis]